MNAINWKSFLLPYQQATDELLLKIQHMSVECKQLYMHSPIDSITGRVKQSTSILDKAKRKHYALAEIEDKIEDIAGIRIVCQFVEDIEKVAGLLRNRKDFKVLEERDYITNTKPSGYRSYHLIIEYPLNTAWGVKNVLAEIQIRTIAMNFWATAEHSLRYKYSGNIPDDLQERLTHCAEAAYYLDQEMSTIKEEIRNAQRLNAIRSSLVSDILEKIQSLNFRASIQEKDEIDKEFIAVWNKEDLNALRSFNQKLDHLATSYNI
ncbi:GTP pyrophosphokinase family protein [Chakrabartyella piscis]|uniref:GTP pyrophosphokinase n=1 Tax=Chakrabartyella piscis TaxID=2918914 RepID=UPI0029587B48|nr:GTP pyrophosphokinase family protein [Chakrabartyella piscis]